MLASLDERLVLDLLANYLRPHEVLFVNKHLHQTCKIDLQALSLKLARLGYRRGGHYLKASVSGTSHSRRDGFVLKHLLALPGTKQVRRWAKKLIAGQSAELHACALSFLGNHQFSLRQVVSRVARAVLQNELDYCLRRQPGGGNVQYLAGIRDPLPPKHVLSFVFDTEAYLPNTCAKYLNLCTTILLSPGLPVDPDLLYELEMTMSRCRRMELYHFVLKHFDRVLLTAN